MSTEEKNYAIWHPLGNVINHECNLKEHEYQLVGNVKASTKEQAFINSQNFSSQWELKRLRSTCVGDIISDGEKYYMVKGMGFQEIISLTRLYIVKEKEKEPIRDLTS
jgi:hypothetical protein